MSLFEIKAEVPFDSAERVDELLLEAEDGRWSLLQDVIARQAWVIGIFADPVEARAAWELLRPQVPETVDVVSRELPDADWRDSYKAHFKAWRCGRLHWVPVWERETYRLPDGDVALWLDPGLAFGTGNHETTRLCCERLIAWTPGASAGSRVIDAGCGSGILALSAARLGVGNVNAFDNDPEAVRVSRENAALNGLEGRVRFETADLLLGLAGRQAELVLANIQADVLMRFARELVGAVAPGGILALSGVLAQEGEEVREAFAALAPGWRVESRVLGEWCDVAVSRPGVVGAPGAVEGRRSKV